MMSEELTQLISVLQEQIRVTQHQHKEEMEQQRELHMHQLDLLKSQLKANHSSLHWSNLKFQSFDSMSELWKDCRSRFQTFTEANSIPEDKLAFVFLTNQSSDIYKLIDNFASQLPEPMTANKLSLQSIHDFMSQHYDPKCFIVREWFRFWSEIKRKPGETPHKLAAKVRQMATTCDFTSIKDPLDEAMRTCFLCAINNEAVLKAAFKTKENELTFQNVVQIATEVEEAAKTAKAQLYPKLEEIHKITKPRNSPQKTQQTLQSSPPTDHKPCGSCGKKVIPETNAVSEERNAITARRKATLKPHATANKLGRSGVLP